MVLAHKNLEQVSRLVAHLQASFDVFIHVDKKSAITMQDFQQYNRTTVTKKFKASWGSLGIVHATLELLTLASQRCKYDRFVLISGQDIPLTSNDNITSFFSRHSTAEFIDSRPFLPEDESRLTRITRFHFFSRKSSSGAITQWAADVSRRLDRALMLIGIRRSMNYRFRWGSQWMDLSAETVSTILEAVHKDSKFLKRFRFTFCPDEFFFQTAVENFGSRSTNLVDPQRYIDWETGPEHPRVLRAEDLERIRNSGMLFARKCDSTIDSKLIDDLYRDIERKS